MVHAPIILLLLLAELAALGAMAASATPWPRMRMPVGGKALAVVRVSRVQQAATPSPRSRSFPLLMAAVKTKTNNDEHGGDVSRTALG
jgi:hypothetical protein